MERNFLSLSGTLLQKIDRKFQSRNAGKFQKKTESLYWNFLLLFRNDRKVTNISIPKRTEIAKICQC